MNIILISPLPPPVGGIASWTQDYMRLMQGKDYNITLIDSRMVGRRADGGKVRLSDELSRTRSIRRQLKQALKCGAQIVHYNASCSTFGLLRDLLVLRAVRKRAKIVYHCHCNLATNVNNKIARCLFKKILKKSSLVLTLNRKSFAFAEEFGCKTKIELLPNFIECVDEEPFTVRANLENAVFVGRATESKGIFEFLALADRNPSVTFHVIGPAERLVSDSVTAKNVVFHGAVEHAAVAEKIKENDILILPSYSEGFPLVVLEAMACGVPVLATDVGSIPDMLEGQGGVTVPVKDVDALQAGLSAMASRDVRASMSLFNREKAARAYVSSIVIENLKKLYSQLV